MSTVRKHNRIHLRQYDHEHDEDMRDLVADIKDRAAGNTCGSCAHAVFGDYLGLCLKAESVLTGGALRIESRGATACRKWERR